MDFSVLNQRRVILGATASILLLISLFLLPWYELDDNPQRDAEVAGQATGETAFVCGVGEYSCTGWETFPIMRWLLLAAAFAPLILGWILVRGHKLSWAPGEMTMVVGFTAFILILYNGIIDRPGSQIAEAGVGIEYGYWIALIATALMAATGFLRSQESGGAAKRKAPGTV